MNAKIDAVDQKIELKIEFLQGGLFTSDEKKSLYKGTKIVRPLVDSAEVFLKKYVEETIERKRCHIKNVPLSSLSGIRKPGTPAGLN
jgi:hypothetical protein